MRFVSPETVRIDLADGDWIDVKKELSTGEETRYRTAGLRRLSQRKDAPGQNEVDVDWEALAYARAEAYIVDWSAKDARGKDVKLTPAALRNLAAEDFQVIDQAILAHIEAMAEEKKVQAGSPSSTAA